MNRTTRGMFFTLLAVVLVAGLLLSSCAPAPSRQQAPVKLRYSTTDLPTTVVGQRQVWFAEEVGKRTKGQVTIEMYLGGELYGHANVVDAVSANAIEMGMTSGGIFGARTPILSFYAYFLMLENHDHYARAKDDLKKLLFPLLERENVKPINLFDKGDSGYFGRKPMVSPADMKGMKLRGPNAENLAALRALGAAPVSLAIAELYDVLAKGGIDGAFSNWGTIYANKWYEVTSYFTGPFWSSVFLSFMNLDTWNKLSPDAQKTIMEVARETEEMSFKEAAEENKASINSLRQKGTVTILTAEQTAKWLEPVRPIHREWVQKTEKAGYGAQAAEIMKILDRTRTAK